LIAKTDFLFIIIVKKCAQVIRPSQAKHSLMFVIYFKELYLDLLKNSINLSTIGSDSTTINIQR